MCSTPNPVENVFCSNCGARLVPLTSAAVPDAKPPAPPIKGLSLPAKPEMPGETQASEEPPSPPATVEPVEPTAPAPEPATEEEHVPEWLARLRETSPAPQDEESPAAEESAPLPEWITPTTAEPTPEQTPAEPTEGELPEWLKQAHIGQTQPPELTSETEDEIPDWLKQGQTQAPAAPAAAEIEPAPDWLAQAATESAKAEEATPVQPVEAGAPEPVSEVEPTQAIEPAKEPTEPFVPSEPLIESLEATVGSALTQAEAEPVAASPSAAVEDDGIPDWLRAAAPPSTPVEPPKELEQPLPSEVPAWVAALKPAEAMTPPLGASESEAVEAAGPLQGLRGVLPLALAIAEPHPPIETSQPASRADGGSIFESILAAPTAAAPAAKPARRALTMRPLIYLLLLLAVLVPFLLPYDITSSTFNIAGTPAAGFYDTLQKLPAGSTVLLSFDYDPSMAGEMDLLANAVVRDLVQRRVNIIAVSTLETGPQIAQRILDSAASATSQYTYGSNYLILYLPGNEAGLANLATAGPATATDFVDKKSAGQFPVAANIKTLRDVALVIDFAGTEDALKAWVEQVQPRVNVRIAAAVSASVEPKARAYRSANQLTAMMSGLMGAAQYEVLSNQPQLAVISVNAQTAAQLVVVFVIVLGNIVFWISRARGHAT